jgi:hypothetical protein
MENSTKIAYYVVAKGFSGWKRNWKTAKTN